MCACRLPIGNLGCLHAMVSSNCPIAPDYYTGNFEFRFFFWFLKGNLGLEILDLNRRVGDEDDEE